MTSEKTENSPPKIENLSDALNSKNEVIIYELRPSFKGIVFGTPTGILILLLSVVTMGLSLLIFPIIFLLSRYTNYTITNQRIIIKSGILTRDEDDIEFYRVKDAKSSISLLNRMARIGSVTVTSSEKDRDSQKFKLEISDIKYPKEVREIIRAIAEHARTQKKVREFDLN